MSEVHAGVSNAPWGLEFCMSAMMCLTWAIFPSSSHGSKHATIPCLAFALGHRADVLLPALPGQPGGLISNIAHVIADMQIPMADNALLAPARSELTLIQYELPEQ